MAVSGHGSGTCSHEVHQVYAARRYTFAGRPIKIELVKDEDEGPKAAPQPQATLMPSLLQRISPAAPRAVFAPAPAPAPVVQPYVMNGRRSLLAETDRDNFNSGNPGKLL